MQNMEDNSHVSPYVKLLWSILLEWEERICLLIGLFQISGEIPAIPNCRHIQPKQSPLGYVFRIVHMGTIIYEK